MIYRGDAEAEQTGQLGYHVVASICTSIPCRRTSMYDCHLSSASEDGPVPVLYLAAVVGKCNCSVGTSRGNAG